MSQYKIPNIPSLNFIKKDELHYLFKSDEGELIQNVTKKSKKVKNVEIAVSNKIIISFSIKKQQYKELFFEEGEKAFHTYSLSCKSRNYDINLFECYEIDNYKKNDNYLIRLTASTINLVKDGKRICDSEKVNVWNIIESENILQNGYREFKKDPLCYIHLKASNTLDYERNYNSDEELLQILKLQENQIESFEQLLNQCGFLFYKTRYYKINPVEIENIKKLSKIYEPKLNPIRMTVIGSHNHNKLEINIESDETYYINNASIFASTSYNYFKFIHSSYHNYIALKNTNINADLLMSYYVLLKNESYLNIKIILCSIFFEILKDYKLYSEDLNLKFSNKIKKLTNTLKIDSESLFKYLQPDFYYFFKNITVDKLSKNYSKTNIKLAIYHFRKNYAPALIEFYRNKTIHTGEFEIDEDNLKLFVDTNWKPLVKNELRYCNELIDEIGEFIKSKGLSSTSIKDVSTQSQFLECIIDIIILNLFKMNCELANYPHFEEILGKKREIIHTSDLVEKFRLHLFKNIHYTSLKILKNIIFKIKSI